MRATPLPTQATFTATTATPNSSASQTTNPTSTRAHAVAVTRATVGAAQASPTRRGRLVPQAVSDLRKPVSDHAREVIAARAEFLPEGDRALLQAVYAQGQTLRHVALLQSARPTAVSRRVRVLVKRVLHPAFAVVVARSGAWPRSLRAVGDAIFVRGMTIRAAAATCKLTFAQARAGKDAIAAIVTDAPQPSPADVRVMARTLRKSRLAALGTATNSTTSANSAASATCATSTAIITNLEAA